MYKTSQFLPGVTKTPSISLASKTTALPFFCENAYYRKFAITTAVEPRSQIIRGVKTL